MSNNERKSVALAFLFGVFGKSDEKIRMGMYAKVLAAVPADCLEEAVETLVRTEEYLPAVAKVLATAREILRRRLGEPELPTFDEAYSEICDGINRSWYVGCMGEVPRTDPDYGKPCSPHWSCPLVATLYSQFSGALRWSREGDTTLRAQMRQMYESFVKRIKDEQIRRAVERVRKGELLNGQQTSGTLTAGK